MPPITPMNLASAPGEAALNAYLQTKHSTSLTGFTGSGGVYYTLQLVSDPGQGTTTFHGTAAAHTMAGTLTILGRGLPIASSASTSYFLLNPYVPLGLTASSGTSYGLVTSSFPLPTTLHVGDSGPIDNLTYHDVVGRLIVDVANVAVTYSVSANNSTSLLMCLNTVTSNVTSQGTSDGLADGTETDCYTVDASGTAILVSITVPVSGTAVKFM